MEVADAGGLLFHTGMDSYSDSVSQRSLSLFVCPHPGGDTFSMINAYLLQPLYKIYTLKAPL